jgi:hypothetical protein
VNRDLSRAQQCYTVDEQRQPRRALQ